MAIDITYDQGGEFLVHEFENGLIQKTIYSPGKPQAITIIEIMHQVIGILVRTYNPQKTYVDDADL